MASKSIQYLALEFIENKNNKTFKHLIDRLTPGLTAHAYRYLGDMDSCKEVLSKAFITIWEKIDQYDSTYNFSTWVYTIVKNECLILLRQRNKNLSHEKLTENHSKVLMKNSPTVQMDIEVIGPNSEETFDLLYEKTIDEIYNFQEPYRSILIEREINKKQLKTIATELKMNLNTVKTRLIKGRGKLAEKIKEKHKDLYNSYYSEI